MAIESARQNWLDGHSELAAKAMLAGLSSRTQITFLVNVLLSSNKELSQQNEILTLKKISQNLALWPEAVNLFSSLRSLTLSAMDIDEPYKIKYLGAAEDLAKTIYNFSQSRPFFDRSAPWRFFRKMHEYFELTGIERGAAFANISYALQQLSTGLDESGESNPHASENF